MKKKNSAPHELSRPTFVLVGPLADAKQLAKWSHEEFRESSTVAFIAVDSGFVPLVESGLPIMGVIGDFDGKGGEPPEEIPSIRLKREKDRSDLAVALMICEDYRAEIVYAYGFQGGRADHDFGVHLELSEASRKIPRVVSLGSSGAVFYLCAGRGELELSRDTVRGLRNAGVKKAPKSRRNSPSSATLMASVFPIGGPGKGVKLRGLRFKPTSGILSESSQGLSNEVSSSKIAISIRKGRLAIFFPHENSE